MDAKDVGLLILQKNVQIDRSMVWICAIHIQNTLEDIKYFEAWMWIAKELILERKKMTKLEGNWRRSILSTSKICLKILSVFKCRCINIKGRRRSY